MTYKASGTNSCALIISLLLFGVSWEPSKRDKLSSKFTIMYYMYVLMLKVLALLAVNKTLKGGAHIHH